MQLHQEGSLLFRRQFSRRQFRPRVVVHRSQGKIGFEDFLRWSKPLVEKPVRFFPEPVNVRRERIENQGFAPGRYYPPVQRSALRGNFHPSNHAKWLSVEFPEKLIKEKAPALFSIL